MHVKARLDVQTSQKIDYLTQAAGQRVSHVLREAIAAFHGHILKTDLRVFKTYRWNNRKPFRNLLETPP